MKILRKEKKKFFIFLIAILSVGVISFFNNTQAMKYYQEVDFNTGLVTASTLNVRSGPSLGFKIVSKVHKNEYVRVFAKIDHWYVIQTDKDIIGAVYADYIKPIYPDLQETSGTDIEDEEMVEKTDVEVNVEENKIEDTEETATNNKEYTSELTEDEKQVLNLINDKRQEAGLDKLKIDDDLQNICRIKAKEMVEKDYFAHNSPEYGSPFEMIKSNGITYKVAGENIAGNSEISKAIDAWMNSENHRANIINRSYNYTGIGVVDSKKYGKIFVQMFIGR